MDISSETRAFIDMAAKQDYIILDTETTGLDQRAEICQIAIIDSAGNTLLDTLVRPVRGIPYDAERIHGITDEMVQDAPIWPSLIPQIDAIVRGRNIIVYNAIYDRSMFHRSSEAHALPKTEWRDIAAWHCAMLAFSEIYGEWNDYHGNYRWQKLTTAARYYSLPVVNAHSALGDCLMTLGVVRALSSGEYKDADND